MKNRCHKCEMFYTHQVTISTSYFIDTRYRILDNINKTHPKLNTIVTKTNA